MYPCSRLFIHLVKGLESKNSRVRVECMDACSSLVSRNGIPVISLKSVSLFKEALLDRDSAVRNAAVAFFGVVKGFVDVWDFVGEIGDREREVLEEKFKRMDVGMEKQSLEKVVLEKVVEKQVVERDIGETGIPKPTPVAVLMNTPVKTEFALDFEKFDFPHTPVKPATPAPAPVAMMDFIINQITDTDADMSLNALKHLESTLASDPKSLEAYMDDIVVAVTIQIRLSFINADIADPSISKLCKQLVNMLVLLFSTSSLAVCLKREGLLQCVKELLTRLLDPCLDRIDGRVQLTKALNVLMVRILENCDKNSTFRYVPFKSVCCLKSWIRLPLRL